MDKVSVYRIFGSTDMNISNLRIQTPGTRNVIHFNNAGASLPPDCVTEAMVDYLNEEARLGGYETARKYREELGEVYESVANFIHAEPDEIAILENATAAWNMAFYSIDFREGDRILTSVSEYASNYISYLRLRQEIDIQIEIISNDRFGQTSVEALESVMDENVKLVSITHIPTNSGLVNPVEAIGEITRKYDCLYLVDACQSVGHYPVNIQQIGCDMLSVTGRKYLRGPRGTGFLFVNKKALPRLTPPFLDLHSAEWIAKDQFKMRQDARRFENWEANYAGILGLKTAVEYADKLGISNIWNRVRILANELRAQLAELPEVTVQDIGQTKGGIVTFTVDSISPEVIQKNLAKRNINVSVSSKSSTLIDMQHRGLEQLVRASVHYYNTEEEIGKLIEALKSMID